MRNGCQVITPAITPATDRRVGYLLAEARPGIGQGEPALRHIGCRINNQGVNFELAQENLFVELAIGR
jgi:hypothetical protein